MRIRRFAAKGGGPASFTESDRVTCRPSHASGRGQSGLCLLLAAACLSLFTSAATSGDYQENPPQITDPGTLTLAARHRASFDLRASHVEPAGPLPANDLTPARTFQVQHLTHAGRFRLPGEFEHQAALLLSCQTIEYSPGIRDAVRALNGRITLVALYSDEDEHDAARAILVSSGIPIGSIRFAPVPHNTMWTRDYGPITLVSMHGNGLAVVDSFYREAERKDDELVPLFVAESARIPVVTAAIKIDGGNVISNGQGIVVTTTKLFDENPQVDEPTISAALQAYFGAEQIVYLEPLANESTGHVDMFATFTAPHCVVVGRYDGTDDPVNREILDRNARRLQSVSTRQGLLQVHRIPMPNNTDGIWRTYTNVVYANGVLLMPVYSNTNLERRATAIATYRILLPGWTVTPIDADNLILSGGALHCVMLNLGPLSAERIGLKPFPRRVAFIDSVNPSTKPAWYEDDLDPRW